ncbi:MAG: transcriptional repressor LexA [Chloroflexi bacterium]|nr:transcriptional repressor LexA [Chloroflexota bacterium]
MAVRTSEKQQKILDYLQRFLEEKGYPPSIREIQRACQLSSTSVVEYHLRALERAGLIRRDPDVSRGVELLDGTRRRAVPVPVVGTIAAGQPIAVPHSDTWSSSWVGETVLVNAATLRGRGDVFALRVKGHSMVDALINDGDIILMQPTATAQDGDMVAVWLKEEGEVTLKRFYREKGRIRLQPANPRMRPLYTKEDNVEVQGKVLAVHRDLD